MLTSTLDIYQVCHSVERCVKNGSCSEVKVNGQYCWHILLSQQMSDAIKQFVDDNFVLQQDSASVHPALNTVQLLQCKTLNFLSPQLQSHNSPQLSSTNYLGSHTAAWVWVVSNKTEYIKQWLLEVWLDWLSRGFLRPNWHKIGHFGDVPPSSLETERPILMLVLHKFATYLLTYTRTHLLMARDPRRAGWCLAVIQRLSEKICDFCASVFCHRH